MHQSQPEHQMKAFMGEKGCNQRTGDNKKVSTMHPDFLGTMTKINQTRHMLP